MHHLATRLWRVRSPYTVGGKIGLRGRGMATSPLMSRLMKCSCKPFRPMAVSRLALWGCSSSSMTLCYAVLMTVKALQDFIGLCFWLYKTSLVCVFDSTRLHWFVCLTLQDFIGLCVWLYKTSLVCSVWIYKTSLVCVFESTRLHWFVCSWAELPTKTSKLSNDICLQKIA